MTAISSLETGCCPRFNPEPWDRKEFQWEDKLFVKDRVWCLLYMPMNFGKVITRIMQKLSASGAVTSDAPVVLSDHTSKWNMDLYVEVPREVPGLDHARLSGTFLSKVFEGPFKDSGKWCGEMNRWVESQGKTATKRYMYYTTCPKCAKIYGKNYVVILAQV